MTVEPRYFVGIDLGTTHSALAFIDRQNLPAGPQLLAIDQLVAPGETARLPLLPSYRYHAHSSEVAPSDLRLPWDAQSGDYGDPVKILVQGEWARSLGMKSVGRSVSSAKSWLCHSQVDRNASILPWASGAADETVADVVKVSPLVASAGYLHYLRQCWDYHHADHPLHQQLVVLTIPASFDEEARRLTLAAAQRAGLVISRLVEEPTAAFYTWFYQNPQYFDRFEGEQEVLVCDVGGGTTDLTLLKITPQSQAMPKVERIGVGDHLLLGGDNMDLAIAHKAELRLGERRLTRAALQQLAEQCRRAKELALSEQPPEQLSLTLLGSGSRLIGGSQRVQLAAEDVRQDLLEQFFPLLPSNAALLRPPSALMAAGLPYERDAAVTRHVLSFLRQHQAVLTATSAQLRTPSHVLFNGGLFNSELLRNRVCDLIQEWRGDAVGELRNPSPDTAVAQGAAIHALAISGQFQQVTGGSARHYFLLMDDEQGANLAICILPKGTPEARRLTLSQRQFALKVGQSVAFRLATSHADHAFALGEICHPEPEWHRLPPLVVELAGAQDNEVYRVNLSVELTEIGVLQLQAVDLDNPQQQWQLEFETRSGGASSEKIAALPPANPKVADAETLFERFFHERKQDARSYKALREDLERLLGPREQWPLQDLRKLADFLLSVMAQRHRSPVHERTWLHWAGFCLRPGFGDPADQDRLTSLASLHSAGLHHRDEQPVWAEWWNFWRRVAAGLNDAFQQYLLEDIAYYLHPSNSRSRKRQTELAQRAYDDLVRLLGSLEGLGVEQKVEAGGWLFDRLSKPNESAHTGWALGRLGARVLLRPEHGQVLPAVSVQPWLCQLLTLDWRKQRIAALAAVLIARRCGDEALEIDRALRSQVITKLKQSKCPENWLRLVEDVVDLNSDEQTNLFGESLPSGLVLL